MSFHALDQHRQQRLEPLAADAIGRLSQQRQRLAHRLVVDSRPRPWCPAHEGPMQHPQRVFAVIAGHPGAVPFVEAVMIFPPIGFGGIAIGAAPEPASMISSSSKAADGLQVEHADFDITADHANAVREAG
jgi:hypothetical protein